MEPMSVARQVRARSVTLRAARDPMLAKYRQVTERLLPWNGRYTLTDRDQPQSKGSRIYDNTPTRACRTLAAFLMAGATNQSLPWFKLRCNDDALNNDHAVRSWLDGVEQKMRDVFSESNTYRALHQIYEELAAFGTAATIVLPDFDKVIHHYPLTAGEYCIAGDHRGKIDTLYREFDMSVGAIVEEFGYDACSPQTQRLWDGRQFDTSVTVLHAIEPRRDRDVTKQDSRNMRFRSVYVEAGATDDKVLRESGFMRFPALVPRWATAGGDFYGNGPGFEALGDIGQLQHEQLAKSQAIAKQSNPAVQVPREAKNVEQNLLPGGVIYYDAVTAGSGVRAAYEVPLRLDYLLDDIRDVRTRIDRSFFADLLLMMSDTDRRQMTAEEVMERRQEKMLMLGPVLERVHDELLKPLVDLTFGIMLDAGLIEPPPASVQGKRVDVKFVSMLAQAQRSIASTSISRFVSNLMLMSDKKPELLDRLDADGWLDNAVEIESIPAALIVPLDQARQVREARARAQAASDQAAAMEQQSVVARNLAAAPTDTQNALTSALPFQGVPSPAGI